MDGIDVSRGGDGVPQRQHRIVPRNMYPVPFVCFCVSHRQHINLVLTYLLLVRLVDPGSPPSTRYGSAVMMDIFSAIAYGFIDTSTHVH